MLFRSQQGVERRHADFSRADEDDAHRALMKKCLRRRAPRTTPSHRPRHQLIASSDFTLADRRSATRTKIIENLAVRQAYKQPLSHGHRGFAFLAIEAPGSE